MTVFVIVDSKKPMLATGRLCGLASNGQLGGMWVEVNQRSVWEGVEEVLDGMSVPLASQRMAMRLSTAAETES